MYMAPFQSSKSQPCSTTELRTLASYGEALGGRLEIMADFGDERLAFTEPAPKHPDRYPGRLRGRQRRRGRPESLD